MARARAVVGGLLLVLIAAPAYAAPPSHSYGLGELLEPAIEPLVPVTEAAGESLAPLTEPVGEILEPVTDPVAEVLEPVTDPLLEPADDVLAPLTDPFLDPIEDVTDPITDPIEEVTDPITDPILDPAEEILDPIIDPVENVIDPTSEPNPPPAGGNPSGGPATPPLGTSDPGASEPLVDVAGSLVGPSPSSRAELVSSTVSLLPPPSTGVVLTPTLAQSVLSQILDWLSEFDAGSLLAAPFLGLQVLLRALASAGRGLLVPGVMLAIFAFSMARDRRIRGTKTA